MVRLEVEQGLAEGILSLLGTALWLYDFDDQVIIWANAEALRLWNAPDIDALLDRFVGDQMSPGAQGRLAQLCDDLAADPDGRVVETWTLYPAGVPTLVECSFRWCPHDSTRRCALVEGRPLAHRDADTMRGLDAILHSEAMIGLYSIEGEYLFANRALRMVTGKTNAAFGANFMTCEQRERFLSSIRLFGHYRETVLVETEAASNWYDIYAARCNDAASGKPAFQVTAIDVTQAQLATTALMEARDSALSADHAKSEFLANMSHEMRTPMNGILGLLEILSVSDITDHQRETVEVIRASGLALLELLEDVLDLSTIELKAVHFDDKPFHIRDQIGYVVAGLMPPASAKGLELALHLAPDIPDQAHGDARRLMQVIRNLIGNAIKFTDQGSIRVDVRRGGAHLIHIAVEDTGPGVPDEDHEKVFQRFNRIDMASNDPRGGAGLGLSICHDLITMIGGRIGIENGSTGGARFWFTYPLVFPS